MTLSYVGKFLLNEIQYCMFKKIRKISNGLSDKQFNSLEPFSYLAFNVRRFEYYHIKHSRCA